MGLGGQRHALPALPPGKILGTNYTGGWLGPRAGLDGCGKSRLLPGFDPRAFQPVAHRYVVTTDFVRTDVTRFVVASGVVDLAATTL